MSKLPPSVTEMALLKPHKSQSHKRRKACPSCNYSYSIKSGKTPQGKQRYQCVKCKKRYVTHYEYTAYQPSTNPMLIKLVKNAVGIRGIGRVLSISPTTVLSRILDIALNIKKPAILCYKTYELDELKTYSKSKKNERWLVAAYQRESQNIVDFRLGRRTKKVIKSLTQTILNAKPLKIYTDKLNIYPKLISKNIHRTITRQTNHIERWFLSIRNGLKRFTRKTLSYSKKDLYAEAVVQIYIWG